MGEVTKLDVKPDRMATQLRLHAEMSDEAWELVRRYQEAGLVEPLVRGVFNDIAFELQMGPAVFIEEGPA